MTARPLTTQQHRRPAEARRLLFAHEYLVDRNATQAAIRAGYSSLTAQEQGTRLLSDVRVRTIIEQGEAETRERLKLTRDDVVDEARSLAWSDLSDVMPWTERGPRLLDSKDIDPRIRRQVKSISWKRSRRFTGKGDDAQEWEVEDIKLVMHDKIAPLQMLAKHLGVVKDGPETVVNNNLNLFGAFASMSVDELRALAAHTATPEGTR